MNKQKSFHTLSYQQRWMPLALSFVLAIIYIFGQLNVPQRALASAVPGGNITNPIVRAVDLAKPAVVRIITTIGGRLTVHFPVTNSPAVTFPQDGSEYNLDFSGSGAFISAHGDVLTADHVIKPSSDPSLDLYLQDMAAQDVADYVNANFTTTSGGPYTKDDALKSLNSGYFRSESKYASPSSE
ncbi:MAG TPA: S1C family serine protease, partial [Ktedonobacteraceae bacterium]|nr:S1C family serine protease [Ktedonobacteraceae bacterium]